MSNRSPGYITEKPIQTFPDYGPGKCKYCSKVLGKHKRFYCCYWHGALYRSATSPNKYVSWAEIRALVLKRDNYKCLQCGEKADQVHHIVPVCVNPDLEFEMSNLESRCLKCHKHKGLWGKKVLARKKAIEMVVPLDKFGV